MKMSFRLMLSSSGLLYIMGGDVAPAQPLTVCEIIQNRATHSETLVSVRGELVQGEHYAALSARCPISIITGHYTWPSQIVLMPAQGAEAKYLDSQGIAATYKTISTQLTDGIKHRILVTVTGRVEGAKRLEVWKNDVGEIGGSGYGFAGRFPVQIWYRAIDNPVVLKLVRAKN